MQRLAGLGCDDDLASEPPGQRPGGDEGEPAAGDVVEAAGVVHREVGAEGAGEATGQPASFDERAAS